MRKNNRLKKLVSFSLLGLLSVFGLQPIISQTPTAFAASMLNLQSKNWKTSPSRFSLFNDPTGNLYFNFPVTKTKAIRYLYNTTPPKVISGQVVITLAVETTGIPIFKYDTESFNTCATPATVRPFIWAHRNSSAEFDRWWSNPTSYTLAEGSITLTIPLTPDLWSSVNGKFGNYDTASLAGFTSALENVSSMGVTFGGGCFFGHGVYVSDGTAKFILNSYEIIP